MNKVTVKLEGLLNLAQFLKVMAEKKHRVQVGVFGHKAARENSPGVTNAEVGIIQEMGSLTRKIPRRSFLHDPLRTHASDLMAAVAKDMERLFRDGKVALFLKRLGLAAEDLIQEAFESRGWGKWAPNAPSTVKSKGSDSPLINHGELRRSISSRVV